MARSGRSRLRASPIAGTPSRSCRPAPLERCRRRDPFQTRRRDRRPVHATGDAPDRLEVDAECPGFQRCELSAPAASDAGVIAPSGSRHWPYRQLSRQPRPVQRRPYHRHQAVPNSEITSRARRHQTTPRTHTEFLARLALGGLEARPSLESTTPPAHCPRTFTATT